MVFYIVNYLFFSLFCRNSFTISRKVSFSYVYTCSRVCLFVSDFFLFLFPSHISSTFWLTASGQIRNLGSIRFRWFFIGNRTFFRKKFQHFCFAPIDMKWSETPSTNFELGWWLWCILVSSDRFEFCAYLFNFFLFSFRKNLFRITWIYLYFHFQ